jgi:hypothetical protein
VLAVKVALSELENCTVCRSMVPPSDKCVSTMSAAALVTPSAPNTTSVPPCSTLVVDTTPPNEAEPVAEVAPCTVIKPPFSTAAETARPP